MDTNGGQSKGEVLMLGEESAEPPQAMAITRTPFAANDPMSLPPHGTEVFMGGLPKAATDEEVTAFCNQVGQLHSLRLVKDPTNPAQNKGFAFAVFFSQETAKDAIEQLTGKVIPGHPGSRPIRVVLSEVKNRLFLGNVPKELTKPQLDADIRANAPGLENIELMPVPGTDRNRGFAFVEFYNHAAAEYARKALSPPGFSLRGRSLTVTWAEPKFKGQGDQSQQQTSPAVVKSVYVNKLPPGATAEALQELFCRWGAIERVAIPPPKRTPHPEFAFVHFQERAAAVQAAQECQPAGIEFNGTVLDVQLAKGNPESSRPPGGFRERGMPMTHGGRGGPMYPHGVGGYPQADQVPLPTMDPRGMDLSRMAMVPMMLPNGQMGYMLQDASTAPAATPAAPYAGTVPVASPGYGPIRGAAPGAAPYAYTAGVPTPSPYEQQGRGAYADPAGGAGGGRGRVMGIGHRYRPY